MSRFGDIDGCPDLKDEGGEDLLGGDVSSKIVELLVGVFKGTMRQSRTQSPISAAEATRLQGLAREYRPALTRYFGKRSFQQADVQDLVQEVLVRLAVRGDGASIEQPEAYLMRTATNVWRDFLRKKKTHHENAHDEYQEEYHLREDYGPHDLAEGHETVERIIAGLQELPDRTRQVFVLCRVEGLRQKVVANRLGVSVSAVEKHMIKAIAHLAIRLDK